jgi:hypothetical protein
MIDKGQKITFFWKHGCLVLLGKYWVLHVSLLFAKTTKTKCKGYLQHLKFLLFSTNHK